MIHTEIQITIQRGRAQQVAGEFTCPQQGYSVFFFKPCKSPAYVASVPTCFDMECPSTALACSSLVILLVLKIKDL